MGAYGCGYTNRLQAGKELGRRLLEYAENPDVVVLALARGGVPVAFELARILNLPLEVFVAEEPQGPKARMYRLGRQPVELKWTPRTLISG
jgi:putative phosphoribosyl transferase